MTEFNALKTISIKRQIIDSHKSQIEYLKEQIERYEKEIIKVKEKYEKKSTK